MGSIFIVFFNVLLFYEYKCFAITYVCTLCECLLHKASTRKPEIESEPWD